VATQHACAATHIVPQSASGWLHGGCCPRARAAVRVQHPAIRAPCAMGVRRSVVRLRVMTATTAAHEVYLPAWVAFRPCIWEKNLCITQDIGFEAGL